MMKKSLHQDGEVFPSKDKSFFYMGYFVFKDSEHRFQVLELMFKDFEYKFKDFEYKIPLGGNKNSLSVNKIID